MFQHVVDDDVFYKLAHINVTKRELNFRIEIILRISVFLKPFITTSQLTCIIFISFIYHHDPYSRNEHVFDKYFHKIGRFNYPSVIFQENTKIHKLMMKFK